MDKQQIIDYLYGEMANADRQEFERKLATDPELQQEIQSLTNLQNALRRDEDSEPTGTPMYFRTRKRASIDPRWWMVAASLLLLLIAGRLLDLRLDAGHGQIALQYGPKVEQTSEQTFSYEEVAQLVRQEVSQYQLQLDRRLELVELQLDNSTSPTWEHHLADYRQEFSAFQQDVRQDQAARYNQFLEQMHRDNRNYSRELMEDLFLYVEAQRKQDLEAINEGFRQLSQAIQVDGAPTQFVNQPLKKY